MCLELLYNPNLPMAWELLGSKRHLVIDLEPKHTLHDSMVDANQNSCKFAGT